MILIIKKIFEILKSCGINRTKFFLIIVSSIATIFFEILGIGVFIPIIEILASEESDFSFFGKTFSLAKYDKNILYQLMGIIVFFIMSLKSCVLLLNSYLVARFWSLVNERVSINIYRNILGLDYKNFTKKIIQLF